MPTRFILPSALTALGAILLLLPKINIVHFEGETAGLRIDDLLLGLIGAYVGMFAPFRPRLRFNLLEIQIAAFTLLGAMAWLLHGGSPFYVIRILEYFVFFYIGAGAARLFSLGAMIKSIFFLNAMVMLLQSFSLIGGFTVYGWLEDVNYRVVGLTSGPWEIGLVLNLCFCALLFPLRGRTPPTAALALFALFGYLLILAGGRMPIVAQTLVFLYYLQQQFRRRILTATLVICLAGSIGVLLFSANTLVIERSRSTLNWQNIEALSNAYQAMDVNHPEGFDMSAYFAANTDPSWIMRMSKWCFAFKTYVALGPTAWIFGAGPGRFGPALDGGLLRLLTEHGAAGLFVFASILFVMARQNSLLLACVIAFSVNLLFLDVHITYKAMALLFFISGYIARTDTQALPAANQAAACPAASLPADLPVHGAARQG